MSIRLTIGANKVDKENAMKRGEIIKQYIIDNVRSNPKIIAGLVSAKFKITRQAANKHIRQLVLGGLLLSSGSTRNISYELKKIDNEIYVYDLTSPLQEHVIWDDDIGKYFDGLPKEISDMWHYGFTEMFNNAIDHSSGVRITVIIIRTAAGLEMTIMDDGIGIFKKLKNALGLSDERHAVLELSKGKLTTDPKNHSGEGIFFTSRMFQRFIIISGEVHFSHNYNENKDWIWARDNPDKGTYVKMVLNNSATHTMNEVFEKFTSSEDFRFNKTVVPVELAKTGVENLVSRSQAKRMLARVEIFDEVIFDFGNIDVIGQAFADEVFRVFRNRHPKIKILHTRTNKNVLNMINRAYSDK